MLSAEHDRTFAFAYLTILCLALTTNIETSAERAFATENELIPVDFPVFYLGGKVALQHGTPPLYCPPSDPHRGYSVLYQDRNDNSPWAQTFRANLFPQILRFTNPPLCALVMAPLAMLPWRWAYLTWEILTILLTAITIYLALKVVPFGPQLKTFCLAFAAVCFFYPFRNTLVCGQVNAPILFLWTAGVYLLKGRRPIPSALCFALGTALKVAPIIAVPLLVVRRQWRWLAAYVSGVVGFTAISVWQLGWQTNLTWLAAIYPSISSGVGNIVNRSFAGFIDALRGPRYFASFTDAIQWPVPPGLALLERICSVLICLGFVFWCWRTRKDAKGLVHELILLPLVYLVAAPFSWPHHFVLAILPLTYLWAKVREATSAERWVLCLSTLVLGTELPMYVAAFSPLAASSLIVVAIALWPAATCGIIWVGMRLYVGSQSLEPRAPMLPPQPAAAI